VKTLSKRNRERILGIASVFDRWAAALRRYAKARTPKRQRTTEAP
jgi:hypothetical protein